ncbi:MAG: hypothetical protein DCC54_14545 [Anaerolineae bacterium]|nr:MAG: hypothetical protein DCC54_14545 [Anaerolineae bacterium]
MTFESHLSRGAEDAAHGAARLRGNAERVTAVVFHPHRFDDFAVVELEEGFDGLFVGGGESRDGSERGEAQSLSKFGAQRGR